MSSKPLLLIFVVLTVAVSQEFQASSSRTALVETAASLQEGLIRPILRCSVIVFTIVGSIDFFLKLLTSVGDTKGTIQRNVVNVLQKIFMFLVFNGILRHFIQMANPSANPILAGLDASTKAATSDRRRRDIEEVSTAVMNAILKYSP